MTKLPSKRFFVYAIRLDVKVLDVKKFRDANPLHLLSADCFYVGMTGRTPEVRFKQHKDGYKACRFARDFGLELMPKRFTHCNPNTFEEAGRFERKVAARLRRKGFAVWQK